VMAKLLQEGHDVYPLFGNYNQIPYKGEKKAITELVDLLYTYSGIEGLESVWPGHMHDVIEVHVDTGIGDIAACPGRVLSFVGAACIWAFTNNWDTGKIAIGIHMGDKDQDSCRVGYEGFLDQTLKSLTQNKMSIITPLMGMTREEMAQEVEKLGIPWGMLFNCYWGNSCGSQSPRSEYRCPGCRRKQDAMKFVGRPESEWKIPNQNPSLIDRKIARRDWKYE